jgi:hypothetical protein
VSPAGREMDKYEVFQERFEAYLGFRRREEKTAEERN